MRPDQIPNHPGTVRRLVTAVAAGLAIVGAVAGAPAAAFAQRSACGPFRVEWNHGVLSPTSAKLEGYVYNDSPCMLSNVQLIVVALNGDGSVAAETTGWVFGNLPPRGRGYFALPLPSPSAVDYRIDVKSFDHVTAPNAQAP
jgi:hypothetical protein